MIKSLVVAFCLVSSLSFAEKIGGGGIYYLISTVVDVKAMDSSNDSSDQSDDTSNKDSDGAGFIVSEDGYIATNYHVISNFESIVVVTADGVSHQATLVAKDERSDIALLKINTDKKLPTVVFADSDNIEICDKVLAIGNPFGFGKTVTSGIISYKGRNLANQIAEIGTGGDLVLYLQTDAAVNYGNSGGPLFSYDGKLVGMITVFVSDGGRSTGINFAIPSNLVKKVIDQLKACGQMKRSWIGIWTELLDQDTAQALKVSEIAEGLGLSNTRGCLVKYVESGSPADQTHLQVGDIILSVNGEPITDDTNTEYLLSSLPIGKIIPVTIIHHAQPQTISVRVLSKDDKQNSKNISYRKIAEIGLGVSEITDELRENFNIKPTVKGLLISHTNTSTLPVSVGDVITRVGQQDVSTINELATAISSTEKSGAKKVALLIYSSQDLSQQKGEYHYVSIPLISRQDVPPIHDGSVRNKIANMIKRTIDK